MNSPSYMLRTCLWCWLYLVSQIYFLPYHHNELSCTAHSKAYKSNFLPWALHLHPKSAEGQQPRPKQHCIPPISAQVNFILPCTFHSPHYNILILQMAMKSQFVNCLLLVNIAGVLLLGKKKKKQQQQKNPKKITYFCFSVFAHICRWAVCTCSRGTESSPAHQHLPADGSQKHILCSCVCELTATDSQGYVTGSCCEQQYNNNNKHQYLFHLQLWLSCNLECKASCLSIII